MIIAGQGSTRKKTEVAGYLGSYTIDFTTLFQTKTVAFSGTLTTWGSIYFIDVALGNWVDPFTTLDHISVTCDNQQYMVGGVTGVSNTACGSIRLFKPTNASNAGNVLITGYGVV